MRPSRSGCRSPMRPTVSSGSSPVRARGCCCTSPRTTGTRLRRPRATTGCEHFDVRSVADRSAARAALPKDLSRTAYIGDALPELAAWGVRAVNPPALVRRLDYVRAAKTPYELVCLREANRLGALGHQAAAEAFRAGASEFEIELAFLRACGQREQELPYNPIIALNEGGAVLHYQVLAAAAAAGALFAADRCRRRVRRLRQRHHPHLLGRGSGLRRADPAHGPDAAEPVRPGTRRGRLARHSPGRTRGHRRGPARCGPDPVLGRGGARHAASRASSCRTASGTSWVWRCTTWAASWPPPRAGTSSVPRGTRTCA